MWTQFKGLQQNQFLVSQLQIFQHKKKALLTLEIAKKLLSIVNRNAHEHNAYNSGKVYTYSAPPKSEADLYMLGSKIEHSCVPNVTMKTTENLGLLQYQALIRLLFTDSKWDYCTRSLCVVTIALALPSNLDTDKFRIRILGSQHGYEGRDTTNSSWCCRKSLYGGGICRTSRSQIQSIISIVHRWESLKDVVIASKEDTGIYTSTIDNGVATILVVDVRKLMNDPTKDTSTTMCYPNLNVTLEIFCAGQDLVLGRELTEDVSKLFGRYSNDLASMKGLGLTDKQLNSITVLVHSNGQINQFSNHLL